MKPLAELDQNIETYVSGLTPPESGSDDFDTRSRIHALASAPLGSGVVPNDLEFLSKRLEISKKLFLGYTMKGRKKSDEILDDTDWLGLLIALLTRAALTSTEAPPSIKLKRFNVLFKALDLAGPDWLEGPDGWKSEIESAYQALLATLPSTETGRGVTAPTDPSPPREAVEVPLTVLFYEGPIARAYLETIRGQGLKPSRIIELVPSRDIVSKRPVGRWLPAQWRLAYSTFQLKNRIHYWPRVLQRKYPDMVSDIDGTIETGLSFPRATLEAARSLRPLGSCSWPNS